MGSELNLCIFLYLKSKDAVLLFWIISWIVVCFLKKLKTLNHLNLPLLIWLKFMAELIKPMKQLNCFTESQSLDVFLLFTHSILISVLCRNSKGLKLVHGILLKSEVMNIGVEESTFNVLITGLCRIRKVGFVCINYYNIIDHTCSKQR